jgi:hypothetical protein
VKYEQEFRTSSIRGSEVRVDCGDSVIVGRVVSYDDDGIDIDAFGDITRISSGTIESVEMAN